MNHTEPNTAWTDKIVALPIAEVVDGDGLRFVRHLDAPPDKVWSLVTTRPGWPWFGALSADLRVGGAFEIEFDATNAMRGRITALDDGRRIVLDWVEFDSSDTSKPPREHSRSVLSFDVEPEGHGTRLTLTHRKITREEAPGFGAGWHSHLGRLQALLAGEPLDDSPLYGALLPRYEELISASPGFSR